jgi:4-amino-4-deoxy-L-arabinose transferase-like glycosyltransferase
VLGKQDTDSEPRSRALVVRLRTVIELNRWFSLALLAGAGLRLLAMIGYPGALWFAGDSYVYVGAALRPQPNLSKSTGYSLFLRTLLPFHSFTLVTLVQHLMGLAVAVMIYALLRRSGVSRKWSTIATLPVLLDGYIIENEHLIMAETVFTFCLFLAMLLLLWRTETSWWIALIAGLLVGYAVLVRTEGGPILVLFPAFLLLRYWRTLGWRKLKGWLITAAMAVGCLAPVGAYANWFHSYSGSWGLTQSTGFYLWGRVSSFADCSKISAPANVMKVCPTEPIATRTAPGNFIWHASEVHACVVGGRHPCLADGGSPVSAANNKLLTQFAIDAVKSQPLDYAKAVVKGLLMSVEWPRKNYPGAGTVYYYDFHIHYKTSTYDMLPPNNPDHEWIKGGTAYQDWLSYGHQAPGSVVQPFAVLILGYQRIFYTWGPLFGVIMVMGLGGVIRIQRRPLRLRWSPRTGSMLPWLTGVVLLVFPIAAADFDYRYLIPVIPFACLAAGFGFAPVRRPATPEPPGDAPVEELESATQTR